MVIKYPKQAVLQNALSLFRLDGSDVDNTFVYKSITKASAIALLCFLLQHLRKERDCSSMRTKLVPAFLPQRSGVKPEMRIAGSVLSLLKSFPI